MSDSTICLPFSTSSVSFDLPKLLSLSQSPLEEIVQHVERFRSDQPTPEKTYEFENSLAQILRKIGREVISWTYNNLEPSEPESLPARINVDGQEYRRRLKSPNRNLGTRFGNITLWRFLYEPLEYGEHSIFPLEINLGIEAGAASPALAEHVGQLACGRTQSELIAIVKEDHDVAWSTDTARKVTASISEAMIDHLHPAQVERLLYWLRQADKSKGRHKIVLAVGRDGCMLPIRNEPTYKEGSVATVSVYDRGRRRLGTVYLGRMPEPGQVPLSQRLTRLIAEVLKSWTGPMPRLAYITDAGYHPTQYYETVLQRMTLPGHPHAPLDWIWIVDFYHATEYIGDLGDALFGNSKKGYAWTRKMCKWLKHKPKPNAVFRILHSAAKHRAERSLSKDKTEKYRKAYQYLNGHKQHMNYAEYRRLGLPIGSGVTEAACKTVFTQRFKQSGMSWNNGDDCQAQRILDLRVIQLSGLWPKVHHAFLQAKKSVHMPTECHFANKSAPKAA